MVDAIHGITFIDYCAANAMMAQGKDISALLPTLGVEMPQWDEASAHWERAMKDDESYRLVTILGEVFQNPAQGKFAGASTQTSGDARLRIASLESFIDIQNLVSVAAQFGVDPTNALAQRGLTLMDFSQAGMHYMAEQTALFSSDDGEATEWFAERHAHYRAVHEAHFRAQTGNAIGDDIDF
jgi:hypothetical protein